MADDSKDNSKEAHGPSFGVVTMHKVIERPQIGQRLFVALQLQAPGGVPLSHMLEIPGEVVPAVIAALQELVAQYPQLTTDLCVVGESKALTAAELQANQPSGLVDPGGKPLKGVTH